jgi:protein-L-isoaspartate O-methyltransferase
MQRPQPVSDAQQTIRQSKRRVISRRCPSDRVFEIGAGSGYAAAVAAQLAAEVCAVERHARLVTQAQQRFDWLGYRNITL